MSRRPSVFLLTDTRLWTMEFSAMFGAILSLLSLLSLLGLPFLLSGTSNWFPADALRRAGW